MFPNELAQNAFSKSQKMQANSGQPRELGFLDRVNGIRCGLDEVTGRFRMLAERIAGATSKDSQGAPTPSGMPGNLAAIEERMREALAMLTMLEQAF